MDLLYKILSIESVSGDESRIAKFLFDYVEERKTSWKVLPEVFFGEDFHDCLLLKFGNPRVAVFAHVDTIGFMTRYENQLVAVGGPEIVHGAKLSGRDSLGEISCRLIGDEEAFFHDFPRKIARGTRLSFTQNVRITEDFIQGAYLDNRLGVFNALQLCEELEDGWVIFSTYEEHGGGSMPFLLDFIQKKSPVTMALVSDITWITDGIRHHEGVVISIRDKYLPRKKFLDRVIKLADESGVPYQLEVEAYGGSDGREIQLSPYAIDWCFIGAAEDHVHTPDEKVSLKDLESMIYLYKYLVNRL